MLLMSRFASTACRSSARSTVWVWARTPLFNGLF
jgi:hypothetical protein